MMEGIAYGAWRTMGMPGRCVPNSLCLGGTSFMELADSSWGRCSLIMEQGQLLLAALGEEEEGHWGGVEEEDMGG